MSIEKTNHSVIRIIDAYNIAKSTAGYTTSWEDVSSWTDKKVTLEATVTDGTGSVDVNLDMLVSPKGAYELNNETTVNTEDYELIQIVDNHTATAMTGFDSSDVDDLQRPFRSVAFVLDNDDATDDCTVNVWIEGWS